MRILGICFKRGGIKRIGRGGFFDPARPSVIAQSSKPIEVPWNDAFVGELDPMSTMEYFWLESS
jgi:hypothetical protein